MQAHIYRLLTVAGLSAQLFACGSSPDSNLNLRNKASELDGVSGRQIDFYFGLPDRSLIEGGDAASAVNGFYYKLQGKGDKCPGGDVYEATVGFEDNKFVSFPINANCSYDLTFRLGRLAEGEGQALAGSKLNFATDIKPLLEKNCSSCHSEYQDYASFRAVADQAILDIESGVMPQGAPLSDDEVAVFLAWQAAGYLEADDTLPESAEAQKLSSVYYRNNNDDILNSYELLGRTFFQVVRTLWIQPEGQAQGFNSKYVTLSASAPEQE